MVTLFHVRGRAIAMGRPMIALTFVFAMLVSTLSAYACAKQIVTAANQYNAAVLSCRQRGGVGLLVPTEVVNAYGAHGSVECRSKLGDKI